MALPNAVIGSESATENLDLKMPAPGDAGYDEWRKTGKLPEADGSESAAEDKEIEHEETQDQEPEEPSSEAEASAASEHESEEIAAPEAARPQKGKKDAAARLREVLEERKADRALLRKLTEQIAELKSPSSVKPESRPAAEVEKPAESEAKSKGKPEPQIDDKKSDGTPKYKVWGEYQKDHDTWVAEEAVRRALAAVAEHTTKTQAEQQKTQADTKVDEAWTAKLNKGREKYPDFDKSLKGLLEARDAHGNEFFFARGGAIDSFLQDSELGADVFRYIAQNANTPEVQRIFERTPDGKFFLLSGVQQVRALSLIEAKVATAQPARPATSKAPAKPITRAPAPPHQVSGKPAAQVDEVEQAVKDGDQEAFTRLENERVLERMKARSGRRRT